MFNPLDYRLGLKGSKWAVVTRLGWMSTAMQASHARTRSQLITAYVTTIGLPCRQVSAMLSKLAALRLTRRNSLDLHSRRAEADFLPSALYFLFWLRSVHLQPFRLRNFRLRNLLEELTVIIVLNKHLIRRIAFQHGTHTGYVTLRMFERGSNLIFTHSCDKSFLPNPRSNFDPVVRLY